MSSSIQVWSSSARDNSSGTTGSTASRLFEAPFTIRTIWPVLPNVFASAIADSTFYTGMLRAYRYIPSQPEMVRLCCAVVGAAEGAFWVRVNVGEGEEPDTVADLKKLIKTEKPNDLKDVDPNKLRLFLATRDGAWLSSLTEDAKKLKNGERTPLLEALTRDDLELQGEFEVKEVLAEVKASPTTKQIHVLIVVPTEVSTNNRPEPRDSSKAWVGELLARRIELHSMPFVGGLAAFVAQPLPVKIRAKKKWLHKWPLEPTLRDRMFVEDDEAPCMELKSKIFGKRVLDPFRSGKTESSFHWAWDSVFRNVLDIMFTRARCDRDSCKGSSTGAQRPDFLFILEDVCVFRGEEKAPDVSITVPSEELRSKLIWAYGNVPYVFGYAASGYETDLFALHCNEGVVTKTRIGTFNFALVENRFEAVLAMLNLSLLFPAIVEVCPPSGKDEYKDITRRNGVVLHLNPTSVEKVFPDTGCFSRLKQVYGEMERAGVPNVDRLTAMRLKKKTLTFEPRGTEARPVNLLELFGALRDVLQALVGLHRLGWMHRDIRWSNVIRQRGGGSWFLIDFVDAATSPQPASSGQHLSVEEHAPEIFVEGGVHTTAVDIWAVGYLIESAGVGWCDLADRSSFYERLIAEDPAARPSAEEALRDLWALEESAKRASRKRKLP